jgi:hypothetical protein
MEYRAVRSSGLCDDLEARALMTIDTMKASSGHIVYFACISALSNREAATCVRLQVRQRSLLQCQQQNVSKKKG